MLSRPARQHMTRVGQTEGVSFFHTWLQTSPKNPLLGLTHSFLLQASKKRIVLAGAIAGLFSRFSPPCHLQNSSSSHASYKANSPAVRLSNHRKDNNPDSSLHPSTWSRSACNSSHTSLQMALAVAAPLRFFTAAYCPPCAR